MKDGLNQDIIEKKKTLELVNIKMAKAIFFLISWEPQKSVRDWSAYFFLSRLSVLFSQSFRIVF